MKANISAEGDWSVGIPGSGAVVDFGESFKFSDSDDRNQVRSLLKQTFFEIMDNGKVKVNFSDECSECWELNGKHHKNCPVRFMPEE